MENAKKYFIPLAGLVIALASAMTHHIDWIRYGALAILLIGLLLYIDTIKNNSWILFGTISFTLLVAVIYSAIFIFDAEPFRDFKNDIINQNDQREPGPVNIYISSERQQTAAKDIGSALNNIGYRYSGQPFKPDNVLYPNNLQVRYFYSQDKSIAEIVRGELKNLKYTDVDIAFVTDFPNKNIEKKSIEIWFPKEVNQ